MTCNVPDTTEKGRSVKAFEFMVVETLKEEKGVYVSVKKKT